jgi:hypothetical protein
MKALPLSDIIKIPIHDKEDTDKGNIRREIESISL